MIITAAKASEAAEVLGVELTSLTPKILNDAYRRRAKDCHPDHHGSKELQLWSRVSWSKEVLERWLKMTPVEPPPITVNACRACEGLGRVPIKSAGFGRPMTMICVMCDGSGELRREQPDEMESR